MWSEYTNHHAKCFPTKMKRATCNLSLQATTQHLCWYGNLSKLTVHSLFTPAQKSVQLTGPRSRRAQEVSLSFATPQSNSSKAVGLHHQHVCYISNLLTMIYPIKLPNWYHLGSSWMSKKPSAGLLVEPISLSRLKMAKINYFSSEIHLSLNHA